MKRFRIWIGIAGAAVALSSCSKSDSATTEPIPPNTIRASLSQVFQPGTLTVTAGTTVTFEFQALAHNVTFATVAGAPANIGDTENASVTRVFATAGTYTFVCTLHPGMAGTVVVN